MYIISIILLKMIFETELNLIITKLFFLIIVVIPVES